MSLTRLIYRDQNDEHAIALNGEMMNLTDMWRAAGSPKNKAPYEWARYEGAPFVEAVCGQLNTGEARVFETKKGRGGGTFAHWQIGLAYAKYLSPEFHMWCNTVVREKMETIAADRSPTPLAIEAPDWESKLPDSGGLLTTTTG